MFTMRLPKKPEKPSKKEKPTWRLCSDEQPPWEVAVQFHIIERGDDDEDLPEDVDVFTGALAMVISTKDGTKLKVRTIAGEFTLSAELTEWTETPKPSNRKPGGNS